MVDVVYVICRLDSTLKDTLDLGLIKIIRNNKTNREEYKFPDSGHALNTTRKLLKVSRIVENFNIGNGKEMR